VVLKLSLMGTRGSPGSPACESFHQVDGVDNIDVLNIGDLVSSCHVFFSGLNGNELTDESVITGRTWEGGPALHPTPWESPAGGGAGRGGGSVCDRIHQETTLN